MSHSEIITIGIADDHAIFRDGLKFMLSSNPCFKLSFEAENGNDLIEKNAQFKPDIILTDISMPEMDGVEATQKIIKEYPSTKIIALSSYGDEIYYYRMIKAGAAGFVLKKANKQEIEESIHTVKDGGNFFPEDLLRRIVFKINSGENEAGKAVADLSKREKEILLLICQGFSNNEIAEKLFISPKTVDNHRTNLLAKTATRNSPHLVLYAIQNKLIEI